MKAVFVTPEQSTVGFEPLVRLRSLEMVQILRSLGVGVWAVELPAFADALERGSREIAEFGPDFVIAPNFNYFLLAARRATEALDRLGTPVVALWDDPLGAFANCLLRTDTSLDTWEGFQAIMRHPLFRHFSWDRGHIEAVSALGLLDAARIRWYPIATYAPFLAAGERATAMRKARDVAFCGNIYQSVVTQSAFWRDDFFQALTTNICDGKLAALDRSIWEVLVETVEGLPAETRQKYELYIEHRRFWEYYLFTAWHAANTRVRLGILGKIRQDVAVFGLFADPASTRALEAYPFLKYQGSVHHFDELPAVYASTRVNVCISNGLVYQGMPSKLIDCLASGGFALTDAKDDLRRFFGPVAEKIFFRTVEELNAKIEYYLARPREREAIADELRQKVKRHCTLEGLFTAVLACVAREEHEH